jgi:hypothetical protein
MYTLTCAYLLCADQWICASRLTKTKKHVYTRTHTHAQITHAHTLTCTYLLCADQWTCASRLAKINKHVYTHRHAYARTHTYACTSCVQIGGCVPADSLTISPVDAIFVRMGAKVRPSLVHLLQSCLVCLWVELREGCALCVSVSGAARRFVWVALCKKRYTEIVKECVCACRSGRRIKARQKLKPGRLVVRAVFCAGSVIS